MALNIAQRRLGFILQKRSYGYAVLESGIPKSTLWYAKQGIRALPKKYTSALRNLYQRESYHRLHDAGFSAINAKQLSWYSPESARLKIAEMSMLVQKYTLGGLAQAARKAQSEGQSFDADAEYDRIHAAVIKGLQKSKVDWQLMAEYDD
ncbi:hypothetical protein ES708_15973 [subsurface metagenome]